MKTALVLMLAVDLCMPWGIATVFAAGPGPLGPLATQQEETEDKAEKERRKKEEKAAKKELKEARETDEVMDEIREEMDELALGLTRARYRDEFLQDYINDIGQTLVPKETPSGVLFSFRVVDDPSPNALALPDGRIYVNSGLLVFVRNEAELATVLGHEIGHVVEQHQIEAIRESRSLKRKLLPSLLGAVAGATVGAIIKGKEGAAKGAAVGAVAGLVYSIYALNNYGRKQEDEADRIGTRLSLARGYDTEHGALMFQRLADAFGDNDRLSNLLWGRHSRNVERAAHIRALLGGELSTMYNSLRGAGNLTVGSGQMHLYTSRMYRDAAIGYMDFYDRYDIAKSLLESVIDYRARDPRALWALGRVYKMVGRTPQDKAKALDYLQRAVQADERSLYPYLSRDLGLMQARLANSPSGVAPAVESLKKYIVAHVERNQEYPDDLQEMYDYLLAFGDSKWTAPKLETAIVRMTGPLPKSSVPGAADATKALRSVAKKPAEGQSKAGRDPQKQ